MAKIDLRLNSRGFKKGFKDAQKAIDDFAKANGLTVTAVTKLNKQTGKLFETFEIGFKKITKNNDVIKGSFKATSLAAKDLKKEFDKANKTVSISTDRIRENSKAVQERNKRLDAAITRQRNLAKGAVPSRQAQFGTPKEAQRINELTDRLRVLAKQAGITDKRFNKLFAEVSKGNIQDLKRELNLVQRGILDLITDTKLYGAASQKASLAARNATLAQITAQAKLRKEVQRTTAAERSLGRQFQQRALGRVTSPKAARSTATERNAVAKAEDALRKLARTSKVTGKEIDKVFADLSKGRIVNYNARVNRVRDAVIKLNVAEKNLGKTAETAHLRAAKAAARQRKELEKTRGAASSLAASVKSIAVVSALSIFIGGLFRLQQALIDGTENAIEFSKSIAEIQTIQGQAGFTTAVWASQLTKLSDAFGISVVDQAEAAYQTLSNQVAKGADTFTFLEAANKLALTAVTDTSSAVNLLTSVVNAFQLPAGRADEIAAKLFKTVELGRVRIDEMAETLGRIGVPAARVGIRFEELLASIAVTTRQGIRFNEAATLLRGIIQKLVKPTEEMKDFLQELGFASAEAAIRTLGLAGFLGELDKKAQGSSTEIGKLFNRVRASTGALIFAGEGLNQFNEELGKIDATNIEDFEKTAAIVSQNIGKRFEKELIRIENVFKDIGQRAIKTIVEISDKMGGLAKVIGDIADSVGNLFKRIQLTVQGFEEFYTLVNNKTGGFIDGLVTARNTISSWVSPLSLAIKGFGLLFDEVEGGSKVLEKFNKGVAESFENLNKAEKTATLKINERILAAFKERNRSTLEGIREETKALFANNKTRVEAAENLRRQTDAINNDVIKGVKAIGSAAKAEFNKLTTQSENTVAGIRKAFLDASQKLFAFDLKVSVEQSQINLLENQFKVLQKARDKAQKEGDSENFERITKQINQVAAQRFTAAQKLARTQREADKSVFAARANLARAEGTQDQAKIKAAKDRLKDAKRLASLAGVSSKEELEIQQKIVEVRRKLKGAAFRSPEAKALKIELQGLRAAQLGLVDDAKREEDQRKKIVDLVQLESKLRLKLLDELDAKAKAALQQQLTQKRIAAELVDLDKQRRAFDLEKTIKGTDPDQIQKELENQEKVIKRTLQVQKQLGVDTGRVKLEEELNNLRIAGEQAVQALRNKGEESRIRKREDEVKKGLKDAQLLGNKQEQADAKRLNALRSQLGEAAKAFSKLNVKQFGRATGLLGTKEASVEQRDLVDTLKRLEVALKPENIRSGDPEFVQDIANVLDKTIERVTNLDFNKATALGFGEFGGDEQAEALINTLESVRRNLQGEGEKTLGVVVKEVQTRRNALAKLQEGFKAELKVLEERAKAAKKRKELESTFNKRLENLQKILTTQGKEGLASEVTRGVRGETGPFTVEQAIKGFKFDEKNREQVERKAAATVEQNHIAAAKAQKQTVIENAVAGAVASGKALEEFERQREERKAKAAKQTAEQLKKQKADQALAKQVQGLTGFARQVALQDLQRGQSASAVRKREAEAREQQRFRNEDFLRKRRERKAIERGQPLGAIPGGTQGNATQLIEQLKAQRALNQITPEAFKAAITTLKDVAKQDQAFVSQTLPNAPRVPDLGPAAEFGVTIFEVSQGDVILDGQKVGRAVAPTVRQLDRRAKRQRTD
jgi:TP901 family phage tail tape measure protein